MEIQQLKYFVEVVRQQSFTKAAAQLFVTQPMLTRSIKHLEEELNVSSAPARASASPMPGASSTSGSRTSSSSMTTSSVP